MGKVPKHKPKPPSANSRAARRDVSPSIDLDKSIKEISRPSPEPTPHVLGANTKANVSKSGRKKQMSRQQRLRKEKGMARAEAVLDQMQKKVGKSRAREKTIQKRRIPWEELNSNVMPQKPLKSQKADKSRVANEEEVSQDSNGVSNDIGMVQTEESTGAEEEENIPDPRAAFIGWDDDTAGIE